MPVDCLPNQTVLCIPSAYAQVIDYRSLDLQPPLRDEDVAQVGARLLIDAPDLPVAGSTIGMKGRRVGNVWLYWRTRCAGVSCAFEIATVDIAKSARVERSDIYPLRFQITGTSKAGLDAALIAISIKVGGAPRRWPNLASFGLDSASK